MECQSVSLSSCFQGLRSSRPGQCSGTPQEAPQRLRRCAYCSTKVRLRRSGKCFPGTRSVPRLRTWLVNSQEWGAPGGRGSQRIRRPCHHGPSAEVSAEPRFASHRHRRSRHHKLAPHSGLSTSDRRSRQFRNTRIVCRGADTVSVEALKKLVSSD